MFDITKLNEAFRTFGERAKQQDGASTYLSKAEFDPIYDLYRVKIMTYCYKRLGNWEEAKQVTHDAFLKMWEHKWTRLPDKTLVYRLAYQACCNVLRKRRYVEIQSLNDMVEMLTSDMPGPEEETLRTERSSELVQAILRLPVKYRHLMLLAYQGLSNIEIAELLNKKVGTVKNDRSRAYAMLREWLDTGG